MMRTGFRLVVCLAMATCLVSARAGSYEDFFRAVNVDDAGSVAALLKRGFDPNAPSEQGQSALFLALREGSGKVFDTLMQHPGLRIDNVNRNDETPLMMAALRGNLEAVRRLLDRGAAVNRSGWTPLHYAACSSEPKVVALLLDRGADINAESPNRSTPLMMAARYGAEDAALLLLARGANLRARNDQGLDAAAFARLGGRESLAIRLEKTSP